MRVPSPLASFSRSFMSMAFAALFLGLLALVLPPPSHAQVYPELEQGLRPYGSYHGGYIDSVSMVTGHLTVRAPFYSLPQRGGKLKLSFSILYDNTYGTILQQNCLPPPSHLCNYRVQWHGNSAGIVYDQGYSIVKQFWDSGQPNPSGTADATVPIFSVVTPDGAQHQLAYIGGSSYESIDSTGFRFDATNNDYTNPAGYLTDSSGVRSSLGSSYALYPVAAPPSLAEDQNGNQISYSTSTNTITDSLGRNISLGSTSGSTSSCPQLNFPYQSVASATISSFPAPNGGSMSVTQCFANVYIRSHLCGSLPRCVEQSGYVSMLQSIVFADNTYWAFSYAAANPNDTTSVAYGDLLKVVLPTGGSITYTLTPQTILCTASTSPPILNAIATRTVDAADGTGPHTWTYAWGAPSSTNSVTDPLGQKTAHTISALVGCSFYDTQSQFYDSSGNLVKTVKTDYSTGNDWMTSDTAPGLAASVVPIRTTTTWPNGSVTKAETDYDAGFGYHDPSYYWTLVPNTCNTCVVTYGTTSATYGRPIAVRGFDYGTNALLRQTKTTYLWQANSNYLNFNLLDLPSTVTVYDGSGNQSALTSYSYDGSGRSSSGITTQRDTSPRNAPYYGNPTSVSRWESGTATSTTNCPVSVTNGNLSVTTVFFDTGMPQTSTDACGNHTTTYAYSSSFAGAYPTSVTNPLSQVTSANYDFNTGLKVSQTDANNQTVSFTYDVYGRPIQANFPDNGLETFCYTDAGGPTCTQAPPPFKAIDTRKMNSTQNIVTTRIFDGVGRTTEVQLSAPECSTGDKTDTTYDAIGQLSTVSNPYCTTSDPTYGLTTTTYDPVGRVIKVVAQDGSPTTTSYSGNCVTVTDPAGKARKSCSDGVGHLTQVFEDPNGQNFETDYAYDALNDLLCVAQKGTNTGTFGGCGSIPASWRPRTFAYDSLSRLVTASNPESGTISYVYDANGNVITKTAPAPNQTGSTTVTTTYSYDQINRLTQKSYSDGATPSAFFTYDGGPGWGGPYTNMIGRMGEAWTGTSCCATGGAQVFGYDSMGRILMNEQYTATTSYRPMNYTYDLAGNVVTFTDGVGETYTQTFDAASRPTQLNSSWVDSQHPATLVSGVTYSPPGAIMKMNDANGLTETAAYNKRLQPCRYNVNSSGTALTACGDSIPSSLQDFSYSFGSANNGNVASMVAAGTQAFNRTYTYDPLNRLSTLSSPSDPAGCTGLSWTYDPWANQTDQTVTSGSCVSLHVTVGTNNRINVAPYQYDAAGNMIQDASHTYTYDAENRIIQVDGGATATYLYDGLGRRVQKNAGSAQTGYIFDLNGQVISEANSSTWLNAYVRLNGALVAQYTLGAPRTEFIHTDHLGSTRLVTAFVPGAPPTYSVYDSMDYLPFGEQISGATATTHKFTGKERDSESGLDEFGARYYSSTLGRFTIPDWAAAPIDVPYADFGNPQSLNLYAYVKNNPTTFADPDGHCCWDWIGPIVTWLTTPSSEPGDSSNSTEHPAVDKLHEELFRQGLQNTLMLGAGVATQIAVDTAMVGGDEDPPTTQTRVAGTAAEDVEAATITKNAARGRTSEARVLGDLGEVKNSKPVSGSEGESIPDFQNSKTIGEIKDAKRVSNTQQLRIQKEAAQQSGRQHELHTGENTHVTKKAGQGTKVVKRKDLGPQ